MKLRLYCLLSLSLGSLLNANESVQLARINKAAILSAEKLSLYHDGEAFHVKQNGRLHAVPSYDTDEVLRKVNKNNLAAYLKAGLIRVNKTNNGEFVLRSHIKGLGGGVWGAWAGCWAGKFTVHLVSQGIILGTGAVVSLVATPAVGIAVVAALEKTVAVPVEIMSNAAAIAGGIAGGTITGPV
jgi:hypothetical protein